MATGVEADVQGLTGRAKGLKTLRALMAAAVKGYLDCLYGTNGPGDAKAEWEEQDT